VVRRSFKTQELWRGPGGPVLGAVARCRSAIVCLEGGVDGAVFWRRVWKVGAALPPGLGQNPVKEAGGAVRRRSRAAVQSQCPADAPPPGGRCVLLSF